jgi:hypothetical protein
VCDATGDEKSHWSWRHKNYQHLRFWLFRVGFCGSKLPSNAIDDVGNTVQVHSVILPISPKKSLEILPTAICSQQAKSCVKKSTFVESIGDDGE